MSQDGGESWHAFNIGLPNISIISLTIDPSMPNILYIGTSGRGLFALNLLR